MDHTLGDSQGFYMFVETSSPNYPAVEVALEGPYLPPAGEMTMTFWYNMYGSSMGTLRVDYTYNGQVWNTDLWNKDGAQGGGDDWYLATVVLPAGSKRFRFMMTTGGYRSDAAIDDVYIAAGDVSPPTIYPTISTAPSLYPTTGHCLTVHMYDTYGDGWINNNGGYSSTWAWYSVDSEDGTKTELKTGGLNGDLFSGTERICYEEFVGTEADAGCFLFEVTPVSVYDASLLDQAQEISWKITMEGNDEVLAEADYADGITETTATFCPELWPTPAPTSPLALTKVTAVMTMFDSAGDGWEANQWVWDECQYNPVLETWSMCSTRKTGTLTTGSTDTEEIEYVAENCYKLSIQRSGSYYDEITWYGRGAPFFYACTIMRASACPLTPDRWADRPG